MTEVMVVEPGEFRFCPECIDIYGERDGRIKVCQCQRSAGLVALKQSRPKPQPEPDFDTPFEICYYCQATIVRSGSRWSTFYCDFCRPAILEINRARDVTGLKVLPIGRHSIMHANWRHVGASELVSSWCHENLGHYWAGFRAAQGSSDEWTSFAAFIEQAKTGTRFRNLEQLLKLIDETPPDRLFEAIREATLG
jgi:hypothetical protein